MTPDPTLYLDHAATTPVAREALEAMQRYFAHCYANPSSIYSLGAQARSAVEESREIIAESLNVRPEEVFFTSGGTESNNWAVKGTAGAALSNRPHILTTQIEHSSVLQPCESLRAAGCEVTFLAPNEQGFVDPESVRSHIRPETTLVSVMLANNEVGTIEPIREIGNICRERGVLLHTDAVQAFGKISIDVKGLQADLVSLSAHKLYGPKGIGALVVRRGTKLASFMEGGEQERGRRAGTLNVPGIVGFGAAVQLAESMRDEETGRITELRNRLIDGIKSSVSGAMLSGPEVGISGSESPSLATEPRERRDTSQILRLPNNVHFCFEGIEGESLLLALDMEGICASAGSACSAGSTEPSHVLLAMGYSVERARGALRLSLGRMTTVDDVDRVVDRLAAVVKDLRSLSYAVK